MYVPYRYKSFADGDVDGRLGSNGLNLYALEDKDLPVDRFHSLARELKTGESIPFLVQQATKSPRSPSCAIFLDTSGVPCEKICRQNLIDTSAFGMRTFARYSNTRITQKYQNLETKVSKSRDKSIKILRQNSQS